MAGGGGEDCAAALMAGRNPHRTGLYRLLSAGRGRRAGGFIHRGEGGGRRSGAGSVWKRRRRRRDEGRDAEEEEGGGGADQLETSGCLQRGSADPRVTGHGSPRPPREPQPRGDGAGRAAPVAFAGAGCAPGTLYDTGRLYRPLPPGTAQPGRAVSVGHPQPSQNGPLPPVAAGTIASSSGPL